MSQATLPWVLLRGLTRDARHWGGFGQRLSLAFPGATILTPDLPGNGHRFREPSPATIEATVAALRQTLAASGHAPPYRVFALSLGAMVAVEWARAAPEEVAALVLVNTSLRPHAPLHWRLRTRALGTLVRIALQRDPVAVERQVLALTSRRRVADQAADEALVQGWAAWRRAGPVASANALRQLLAAARYRAPAVAPIERVLLLASRHDALVDVRCSRQLARAWQCALSEHPEAGHDLPLDAPEWVIEQLRDRLPG